MGKARCTYPTTNVRAAPRPLTIPLTRDTRPPDFRVRGGNVSPDSRGNLRSGIEHLRECPWPRTQPPSVGAVPRLGAWCPAQPAPDPAGTVTRSRRARCRSGTSGTCVRAHGLFAQQPRSGASRVERAERFQIPLAFVVTSALAPPCHKRFLKIHTSVLADTMILLGSDLREEIEKSSQSWSYKKCTIIY